ncbi:MAG TPA: acetoin dehydrogenase dihydrolipoyllysine-residue acetyltransferase subunit [Rhizomicrobium sp.]|nr:acetoin dehydrogenase dihydrolipoyllysine-residue acetyltransferase subunit [Rhizomicrobium sp.]
MTLHAVTVPKWGLAMEEGQIVHWYVAPGARVSTGDALVDIETPKITNTLEAEGPGTIRRILGAEGETLPCGQVIAVLDDGESGEPDVDDFVKNAILSLEAKHPEETTGKTLRPALVDVGSGSLNYLAMGAPTDLSIILIHGFGGDLNNWMFNQPVLAAAGRTISFDLPGHGGSTKTVGNGSIDELALRISVALKSLQLERFHLVGHSLGGAVASKVAASVPGSCASLTLISSAGLGEEINGDYLEAFVVAKRRRELQKVLESLFADPSLVTSDMAEEILRAKRLDGAEAALRQVLAANFADSRQLFGLREQIIHLDIPIMTIWGESDLIIPATHSNGLPGSTQVLAETGHMAHIEKAAEVNTLIAKHIAAA